MKKRGSRHHREGHPASPQRTVPVVEEVLTVDKRTVQTGVTRIVKRVHEREEVIDHPLLQEKAEVERVPVNRFVETTVPVREQDGTTIIPILEEVLVVEKRLLLKEELHIRTVAETVHRPRTVTLRSEEVEIESIDTPEPAEKHPH